MGIVHFTKWTVFLVVHSRVSTEIHLATAALLW